MSLSITNTVLDSKVVNAVRDAVKSLAGPVKKMGVKNQKEEDLVTLTHTNLGGGGALIAGLVPPNFNLELSAEWAQRNGQGATLSNGMSSFGSKIGGKAGLAMSALSKVADHSGVGAMTHKYLTAHYWEGSAPIRCTIPFEFIAEEDPMSEVIEPLMTLYSIAAPFEAAGILVPPGPSAIGTAFGAGEKISIKVGNILTFDNVVINNVSGDIDTRQDFNNKILHAKVDVSFTSFFTVSRDDIRAMFGG